MERVIFYHFLKTKEEEVESRHGLNLRDYNWEVVEKGACKIKLLELFPWEIKKVLKVSDLRPYFGIDLVYNETCNYILKYMEERIVIKAIAGDHIPIKVRDMDIYTEHVMFLKKAINSEVFYLEGCWFTEFVARRNIREGTVIGLYWDENSSTLRFSVLTN